MKLVECFSLKNKLLIVYDNKPTEKVEIAMVQEKSNKVSQKVFIFTTLSVTVTPRHCASAHQCVE
jgi:hypothetical protein